jgi:hypothetical protein
MTTTNWEFQTESSPGEQAFENDVREATSGIVALFEDEYYSAEMDAVFQDGVRSALAAKRAVTPERVAQVLGSAKYATTDTEAVLWQLDTVIDRDVMAHAAHRFTTHASPGDRAFERTVLDAVEYFETAIDADSDKLWYEPRTAELLRASVRAALKATGTVFPEQLAATARTVGKNEDFVAKDVDRIVRRLEAISQPASATEAETAEQVEMATNRGEA